jgi:NAD(P)-dependent dehydrogenase (short-subunit alcohol dehydrogenase family)
MANFLIIAASSTIGRATTTLLKNEGHSVYTTARSHDKITPDCIVSDTADFESMDEVFLKAQEKLGDIHGVVNFSGSLLLKPAHLVTKAQYEDVISSSLTSAFATVRSSGKLLNDASIVLISSAAASIGLANHEAIAAAKAGVIGLMRSACATYAKKNLRFNVVAPGLVETDLTQNITQNPSSLSYSLDMHPLGRIGSPQDIARAVVFLLDPQNNWITGQVLNVDGGLSGLKTKGTH